MLAVPARAVDDVRTPHTARLCEVCGRPLTGPRPQRVCSPRCRIARWRQTRADATAATLAQLHAENTALRQRVSELARLVGQLKRRLWPGA
jgi:predicted nucleic acid-binding Zn ribbon protein